MQVDCQLQPGRLRLVIYWLGVLLIASCIAMSAGPAWLRLVLILLLTILSHWWFAGLMRQAALLQLWQDEDNLWHWKTPHSPKPHSGRLLQVRHYGLLVSLRVITSTVPPRQQVLLVWRDQVPGATWHQLMVVAHLLA